MAAALSVEVVAAAAQGVEVSAAGEVTAVMYGPLWAPFPQTSPAAEHAAMSVAHTLPDGDSTVGSDNMGTVQGYNAPPCVAYLLCGVLRTCYVVRNSWHSLRAAYWLCGQ